MQITDDGGVDLREFGVVHQEPRFPRPVDGRSLDGGLLGVWGSEAGIQRHDVGPHECFGEIVLLDGSQRSRPDDGLGLGPQQPAGQEHPAAFLGQQAGVVASLVMMLSGVVVVLAAPVVRWLLF